MEPSPVVLTLRSPECLSAVRADLRHQLAQWGRPDLSEDCLLVVSELVSNAFGHGRTPVRLSLALEDDQVLRIQVTDTGSGFDAELVKARWRHPSFRLGTRGRGPLLVDALCPEWGERHDRTGHIVWCDLSRAIT
ncbi:ATP-binding protein [Streptomyces sp. 351MFTsu5.1]|uniref:ATP-binding protein n=1 Tax=Streptomyces sp. 351MFTsu5.1 TaxID=1172180 RepID=UPI000D11DD12|nr:ATP-binding protein [Streptomyces sp. 351MFTsu5.1]